LKNNVLVVIPAYNEEDTIREVVERSHRFADVFVVNDGSSDKTEEILINMNVPYLTHKKNTHIPQSILDGMKYGYDKGYDYIITMDAGLSHLPEELPLFIEAEDSDLVLSVREQVENVPIHRRLLSRIATFVINFALRPIGSNLPKARFRDVTSGYRRYSRKAAETLINTDLKARTFDIHTETLMILYRNGMSISEVGITYIFSNSSLNMKVLRDSIRMFLDMLFSNRS